jgi:hypothetical protein
MAITLSANDVRFCYLRAQQLIPQSQNVSKDVAAIVKEVGGIQAQDERAALLAVRVRSTGLQDTDVKRALVEERSVIRTWGQRGTLHWLAAADIGWLLQLLSPVFIAGDQRRRRELGLDEDTCLKGIGIIRDALAREGPLTRAELVEQLALHGLRIEGQARPHLLYRAAFEGVICYGPERWAEGGMGRTEPTYVLLSDWVSEEDRKPLPSEAEAYVELTCRYLAAYGPATPKSQAAWSGLPITKIRAAWQQLGDQLLEVEIDGMSAWMLKARAAWVKEIAPTFPIVRLLPFFDIYLLGYQNRDLVIEPGHAKRVNAGGGMLNPTLLIDGRVVGIWKSTRRKDSLEVEVEPFDRLASEVLPGLEAEVGDLGRFLGGHTHLNVAGGA